MAKIIQEKIKIPISELILKSKKLSGMILIDFKSHQENFLINIVNQKKELKINS